MKKLIILSISLFVFLLFSSCSSSANSQLPRNEVSSLVNSQNFTFLAQRAIPTNLDVVRIMNSLPGAGGTRMMDLDYGYTIKLTDDELKVELPYYGRVFIADPDTANNSYRFTSKDFHIAKEEGKKGKTLFRITPKDVRYVRSVFLEVFPGGKAYVSIDSNDRQPISYHGYIMKNDQLK